MVGFLRFLRALLSSLGSLLRASAYVLSVREAVEAEDSFLNVAGCNNYRVTGGKRSYNSARG